MAWKNSREIIQLEPEEFEEPKKRERDKYTGDHLPPNLDQSPVNLRKDYGKLQVIVKLANIHLTPEKPNYEGGSWHVEGQGNESICATALYYYDSSNISESLLAFRQQVGDGLDLSYEQDEFRALEEIFGIENGEPSFQDLGKVITRVPLPLKSYFYSR